MAPLSILLPLLIGVSGIAALDTAGNQPGSLSFSLSRERRQNVQHGLSNRADTSISLFNISDISYLAQLNIGTPPQKVRVAVDTGSSELWVDPECQTAQSVSSYRECLRDGQYDPNQSSTAVDANAQNTIPYGIGTVAIEYVKDKIKLPGSSIELDNVQFGVAVESKDLGEGILGISFGNKQGSADTTYPNFIDLLVNQNVIQSRSFSVALGSQTQDNAGVLNFGGYSTSKFSGDLVNLPILGPQSGEKVSRYWVTMSSLSSTVSGKTTNYDSAADTPVVLDTGSSLCTLSEDLVTAMASDLNGRMDQKSGEVVVPDCDKIIASNSNKLSWTFGDSSTSKNITIEVPYSEFLIPVSTTQCILGAVSGGTSTQQGATKSISILGDSFLRSAYVVFDQDNMVVSMAQYASCDGGEDKTIDSNGVTDGTTGACKKGVITSNDSESGDGSGDDQGAAAKFGVGLWSVVMGALVWQLAV